MFTRTLVLPVLTLLNASAAAVVAFPAGASPGTISEVIPGPGLPSPASFNLPLTKRDDGNPASELGKHRIYPSGNQTLTIYPLASRQAYGYNPSCEDYSTGAVNDAIACMNYLYGLGDTACTVTGPNTVGWFCRAGSVAISGNVMFTQPPVSSTWWVYGSCRGNKEPANSESPIGCL